MKKIIILGFATLLTACNFFIDPLATSTKEVDIAAQDYKQTENIVVYSTENKIREHIILQANKSDWQVFQNLPDKNCVVLMGFKGVIDTSEVGVYIHQLKDRCLVRIASLNRDLQFDVAKILYPKLVFEKKKK